MTPKQVLQDRITSLAEPLVRSAGLEIWGLELEQAGRTVVRLFVDQPWSKNLAMPRTMDLEAKDAPCFEEISATLDQCAEISRQLSLVLDVEDLFPNAWTLEVSSPGLDRVFFHLEQLAPYLGQVLSVRLLSKGPDGRRQWFGLLEAVSEESFSVKPCAISEDDEIFSVEEKAVVFSWGNVSKVRLVPLFPKPPKPGKGPKPSQS